MLKRRSVMQASSSRSVLARAIPLVDRVGFFSAVAAAVFSLAFGIGVIVTLLVFSQTPWNGDIRAYAASYNALAMAIAVVPSILLAPAFLGLVVALHSVAPVEKRSLTLLALAFATLYGATVGINYFLQLTVVRSEPGVWAHGGDGVICDGEPAVGLLGAGDPRLLLAGDRRPLPRHVLLRGADLNAGSAGC
jgi:hypothetical protein